MGQAYLQSFTSRLAIRLKKRVELITRCLAKYLFLTQKSLTVLCSSAVF